MNSEIIWFVEHKDDIRYAILRNIKTDANLGKMSLKPREFLRPEDAIAAFEKYGIPYRTE